MFRFLKKRFSKLTKFLEYHIELLTGIQKNFRETTIVTIIWERNFHMHAYENFEKFWKLSWHQQTSLLKVLVITHTTERNYQTISENTNKTEGNFSVITVTISTIRTKLPHNFRKYQHHLAMAPGIASRVDSVHPILLLALTQNLVSEALENF